MSRIDTFAVLADWLHERRGPPSCMGEAGLWLYVLVAVASPGDVAVSDFCARAAKEVDALWLDAPPVLRELLDAAGLAPVHGPPDRPERTEGVLSRRGARQMTRRLQSEAAARVIAEADRLWPGEP